MNPIVCKKCEKIICRIVLEYSIDGYPKLNYHFCCDDSPILQFLYEEQTSLVATFKIKNENWEIDKKIPKRMSSMFTIEDVEKKLKQYTNFNCPYHLEHKIVN